MICPICQAKAGCKETRQVGEDRARRYWCVNGHKFKTLERLEAVFTDAGTRALRQETIKIAKKAATAAMNRKMNRHVAQPPARDKYRMMEML